MAELGDLVVDMRGRKHPVARERALAALAERQHGVVEVTQLYSLGFSHAGIARRAEAGRLHAVHLGVYAVGHRLLSRHGRWKAATLVYVDGSALSHLSAAALWELRDADPRVVDVTVPHRSGKHQAGLRVHRPRRLPSEDVTEREGIPVTSVTRTLVDLAAILRVSQLERALERAERHARLEIGALWLACESGRGRRGIGRLRRALRLYMPAAARSRSELERRLLALCREASLPMPLVNTMVAGFEVDLYWPQFRLAVELDTPSFHGTRLAFERDRRRDEALTLAGIRVVRFTGARVDSAPEATVAALRSLMDGR